MLIETYADRRREGYTLAYHCWRCRRWSDVDLATIISAGRGGDRYVGKRPRCRVCNEIGSMQVQPKQNSQRVATAET
jgi:hypothetical protein